MLNLMNPLTCLTLLAFGTAVVSAADPNPESEVTTTDPKKVKILEDSSREKDPESGVVGHVAAKEGNEKAEVLADKLCKP